MAEQWIRQAALVAAECLLQSALGAARVLDVAPRPRLLPLLVTALCWQGRWHDALRHGTSEHGKFEPQVVFARVWARLELGDTTGAMTDRNTAMSLGTAADAAIAQLRIDVVCGALDALRLAADSHDEWPAARTALADDDRVLVPAEGLIRRRAALPAALVGQLRALTRHDVARLVRARARLVLALASARAANLPQIEDDVARVVRGTNARALLAGQSVVSAWPAPCDGEKPPILDDLVAVLRACQAHDDPRAALPGLCHLLQTRLHASAVLVAGATAHGTVALARVGHEDLVGVARRAAHLGQPVVACASGATDCAVAVSLGQAIVGALACHWAMPDSRLDPANEPSRGRSHRRGAHGAPGCRTGRAARPAGRSVGPAGRQSAHCAGPTGSRGRLACAVHGAGRGRERGRQGLSRARSTLGPRRAAFCASTARRSPTTVRIGAVRSHARRFHRCLRAPGLFQRRRRHALPRRDRRGRAGAQAKLLRAVQRARSPAGRDRLARWTCASMAATDRRSRPRSPPALPRGAPVSARCRAHPLPSLRERRDDVPQLAQHFWERRHRTGGEPCGGWRRKRWPRWRAMIGPVTCANCRTPWLR